MSGFVKLKKTKQDKSGQNILMIFTVKSLINAPILDEEKLP